jgi:hypothetical protein
MPFFGGGSSGDYHLKSGDNVTGGNSTLVINTGTYNMALGNTALQNNTTGSKNVAIGYAASNTNTISSYNTSIGYLAGNTLDSNFNVSIGAQADYGSTAHGFGVSIGPFAGAFLTAASSNNILIGDQAGEGSLAYPSTVITNNCTLIGIAAGVNNGFATGSHGPVYSVGLGAGTLSYDAVNAVAIGYQAGYYTGSNTVASTGQVAIGYRAGNNLGGIYTLIDNSVLIGNQAGKNVNVGNRNNYTGAIGIGYNAFASGNTTGTMNYTNSIGIGYNTGIPAAAIDISEGIFIGPNIVPTGANQIRIGAAQTDVTVGAYNLASLAGGVNLSAAWAALPAANSVATGTIYRVTDIGVGGSHWYSDGTRWRAVGGRITLFEMQTQVSSNNNFEVVLQRFGRLPANFLQSKDRLLINISASKNNALDTTTFQIRVGTAGTTADPSIGAYAFPSGDEQYGRIEHAAKLMATGSGGTQQYSLPLNAAPSGYSSFGAGTNAFTAGNINWANANYFSITAVLGSGGVTMVTLLECSVDLITCGA